MGDGIEVRLLPRRSGGIQNAKFKFISVPSFIISYCVQSKENTPSAFASGIPLGLRAPILGGVHFAK
jgi:hypothetical protein